MTLTIRDAVASDRPAIADFWVAAWRPVFPEIDFEARRAWLLDHLEGLARSGAAVLVACRADRPIGLVTVDPSGHVDQLAVAPAEQGRGTARALLSAARESSGCAALRLTVNAGNPGAVDFYKRLGFTEVSRGVSPHSGLSTLDLVGVAP